MFSHSSLLKNNCKTLIIWLNEFSFSCKIWNMKLIDILGTKKAKTILKILIKRKIVQHLDNIAKKVRQLIGENFMSYHKKYMRLKFIWSYCCNIYCIGMDDLSLSTFSICPIKKFCRKLLRLRYRLVSLYDFVKIWSCLLGRVSGKVCN